MAETAEELRRSLAALRLERRAPETPRRSRRRLLLLVAGVVAVLLVVLIASRLAGGRPATVEVVRAAPPPVAPSGGQAVVPVLSGAGYVVSADRYISIGVRVAGRIDRYLAEEGDHVQAGDPLVQLDAREYEAAVARAEADLREARATAVLRRRQIERARALAREGVISKDELDVRAAEAEQAEAAVGQVEAALDQARIALDYTTLRAPRRGVVLAKLKEVGEIAVPGGFAGSGDLIRMANLDDLRGQVDVTESELAKVRIGQPAEVVPDAYPDRRYAAHVIKLYPQIDRQKGTLRIEAQIEQPDDLLWPDMSARITFLEPLPAPEGRSGILIPRSAVRTGPAGAFAWVVENDRLRRLAITVGKEFGDQTQVTSGLTGGEIVVVGEAAGLREGQPAATGDKR
jgi:RND family efflux transporter MFP subunit